MKKLLLFIISFFVVSMVSFAATITHDISTGYLVIPATSTDDYVLTGTTYSSYNYVHVSSGYHGTITLKNCYFSFSGSGEHSPIRIEGKDDQSNFSPVTNVNLVLDGVNEIYNSGEGRACIQVDQGAQINISAIEACNNESGKLFAIQSNEGGGAGIGALMRCYTQNENVATSSIVNPMGSYDAPSTAYTAGGNVVISSGIVKAHGGHGAGIGGGYSCSGGTGSVYYNGMIVVYGGVVEASACFDAAGIGSGCPMGTGLVSSYAPNSAIIVLPPAQITAQGAGESPSGGVGTDLFPELGLAGTAVCIYVGDENKPAITVSTNDKTPNANIYVDLSQDPDISKVVSFCVPSLDINQVHFGKTDASGVYTTHGTLQNNTTFFTDATSVSAGNEGHPYAPTMTTLPNGGNVVMNMIETDFQIKSFASTYLDKTYTDGEAVKNAACIKITYNDVIPLTDLVYDYANGTATDFRAMTFYGNDSVTPISAPSTLNKGDVLYIVTPLQNSKPVKAYSDVVRISGQYNGSATGYIRQVINQYVVDPEVVTICEGEYYDFHGEHLTTEGFYSLVTTSEVGCGTESNMEMIHLLVGEKYEIRDTFYVRSQDLPSTFRGVNIPANQQSGEIKKVDATVLGCDSIFYLYVEVYPSYDLQETVTICTSELPYTWRDTTFLEGSVSQVVVFNRRTIHDCDSTVTLTLNVYPSYHETIDEVICSSELPYEWRDTVFELGTLSKSIRFERVSVLGCDSIVEFNLTVNPSYSEQYSEVICATELPYTWRDTIFELGTQSQSVSFAKTTVLGCDSVITLSLTVVDSSLIVIHDTVFVGDGVYVKNGFTINNLEAMQTITQYRRLKNVAGCDSTTVLMLNVVKNPFTVALNPVSYACADDYSMEVTYTSTVVTAMPRDISVKFTDAAKRAGFMDLELYAMGDNEINISLPSNVRPDIYKGEITFGTTRYSVSLPFEFMVRYPSSVIGQKWDNVFALRDSSMNGGYSFDQYEWYKEEKLIPAETRSYLYLGEGQHFEVGKEYCAGIKRKGEDYFILTCPVIAQAYKDSQNFPTIVRSGDVVHYAPRRNVSNNGDYSKCSVLIYTLYGNLYASYVGTEDQISFNAPNEVGTYVVRIMENEEMITTQKMIVK